MTIGSIRSSAVFGVVFVLLLLLPLEEVLPVVVFEVEEDEELFLVVVVVVIVVVVVVLSSVVVVVVEVVVFVSCPPCTSLVPVEVVVVVASVTVVTVVSSGCVSITSSVVDAQNRDAGRTHLGGSAQKSTVTTNGNDCIGSKRFVYAEPPVVAHLHAQLTLQKSCKG